jgi:hypothetical protein
MDFRLGFAASATVQQSRGQTDVCGPFHAEPVARFLGLSCPLNRWATTGSSVSDRTSSALPGGTSLACALLAWEARNAECASVLNSNKRRRSMVTARDTVASGLRAISLKSRLGKNETRLALVTALPLAAPHD